MQGGGFGVAVLIMVLCPTTLDAYVPQRCLGMQSGQEHPLASSDGPFYPRPGIDYAFSRLFCFTAPPHHACW